MKKPLTLLLLVTALIGHGSHAEASDRWETLRAINWVENPTNHARYGSKGELGPYQFRATTWRMHTSRPFRAAIERAAADEVAVAHYNWIKDRLIEARVEPSVFNIAMAWNCGVSAVIRGRAPTVSYRYAERVSNLVEQQKREQSAVRAVAALAETDSRQPAALRYSLDPLAPSFALPGQAPRYVVRLAEPEVTAVVRTTEPPEPTQPFVIKTKAEESRLMFAVATSTVSAPRFALMD